MYQKFFIGFFIAAFVCGIMLICGGAAEAAVRGWSGKGTNSAKWRQ